MNTADTFLRLFAQRIRQPGETAAEARERARAELPTVARLAGEERGPGDAAAGAGCVSDAAVAP